jgi:hypothetical protein
VNSKSCHRYVERFDKIAQFNGILALLIQKHIQVELRVVVVVFTTLLLPIRGVTLDLCSSVPCFGSAAPAPPSSAPFDAPRSAA